MKLISIFCDKTSTEAKKIFTKSGFSINNLFENSHILWIRKKYKDYFSKIKKDQILNHLPAERIITTKGNLTKHLKERDESLIAKNSTKSKSSLFTSKDFYSESYLLSDKKDVTDFFNNTQDRNKDIWILKPNGLSRGRGVRILEDLTELKDLIVNKQNIKKDEKLLNKYKDYFYFEDEEQDFIIQRHINNPLLLANKKSEIRVYWLVLSIDPLSVICYNDAIVRLCSEDYTVGDYSNPLKHITNVYQQKKHKKNVNTNELKWSLDMLKDSVISRKLTSNNYFMEEDVMPAIQKALSYIILSAQKGIIKSKAYKKNKHLGSFNYFGLYGCDIMLDVNLKPWVLEVQKGPGLSFSHQHKADVLLPMAKHGIEALHDYKFNDDAKLDFSSKYSWLIYKNKLCI